jgi:hypothetical protein
MSSRITNVTGNEAGVGGGVVSGVNVGMCKPSKNYSRTVRTEGKHILRHDTIMAMNCAGPEGAGNVEGKIVYVEKQFNDERSSGQIPDPQPAPFKKIGEHTTKNGAKIPIYEDPSMGGSGGYRWDPTNGPSIVLGPGADEMTKANEGFHAEADSRGPGGFDGVGHTEDGKELSIFGNEAGSDGASIEAAEKEIKKLQERCDTFAENNNPFGGCYFTIPWMLSSLQSKRADYVKRKKALERADELVKKGKLEDAREVLNDYPVYRAKVPISPTACPDVVDGQTQLYIGGICGD